MNHDIIGRGWQFPPRLGRHGRVGLVGGEAEIERAIMIILRTAPGQRVMRPDFGCELHDLVFMPNNSNTARRVERAVQQALGRWEPRVNVLDVQANPDPEDSSRLLIDIRYRIKVTHDERSLVYPFYLIPEE